ncbi:MAG: Maf family protein [Burkholderiales bacterium]
MSAPQLVLASTSVYRRELLERLQLPYSVAAPGVDESPLPDEEPAQTAQRLALTKAKAVQSRFSEALIIGCDQVASLQGVLLGKPHTYDNAFKQLQFMRGKTVVFHTALCLLNARTGNNQTRLVLCQVKMRDYSDAQIANYLAREQPYHCAGSAKSEGLGIALMASVQGEDPSALIGLPLIALVDLLQNEGVQVI